MITIDGSFGEGGGQILRTALACSLLTGRPVHIDNIRIKRKKPGLQRQHLTALLAAADIGQARISGGELDSTALTFEPGAVRPGEYHFAVGTAGSTTLVLQTVLPALLTASGSSRLVVEGGTHNPFAPPFDFLARVFLPLLERMGPAIAAQLHRPGFYPAGGGAITVEVSPCRTLQRIELVERGEVRHRRAHAVVANLPRHIAERELNVVRRRLRWGDEELHIEELSSAFGPGNVLLLEIVSQHITELFAGFGRIGVRAETVARQVAQSVQRYLTSRAAVGEHLADQLMLPLAMAGGGTFTTLPLSRHAHTNGAVLQQFTGRELQTEQIRENTWRVTVPAM